MTKELSEFEKDVVASKDKLYRLEKQIFKWPRAEAEVQQIGQRELRWLLDGLKITQRSAHRQLHYETML